MEDATIETGTQTPNEHQPQPQNPFAYNNRFPTVLDSDDVTFELGKLTLIKVNTEKLLESLIKKNQELTNALNDVVAKHSETELKNKTLEESNISYVRNNETLDRELVTLRNQLAEKEKLIVVVSNLEDNIKSLQDQLYVENNKYNEKYIKLEKDFGATITKLETKIYDTDNKHSEELKKIEKSYKTKCEELEKLKKLNKAKKVTKKKVIKPKKDIKNINDKKPIKDIKDATDERDGGEW